MDRVDQNREFYYQYKTREAAEKAIKEAENGRQARAAGIRRRHYGLQGKDQASARAHVTIAVPNATAASLKIPDKPSTSGMWLMDAGTPAAHIMIPATDTRAAASRRVGAALSRGAGGTTLAPPPV